MSLEKEIASFEVLTMLPLKNKIFQYVTPYQPVSSHRYFRDPIAFIYRAKQFKAKMKLL
jgi:hypothetical protein